MDKDALIARVKAILLTPSTEWPVIAAEADSVAGLYRRYILLLAALPAVASFLKLSVFGVGVPLVGTVRIGLFSGLSNMLLQYAMGLGVVYLLALLVNALAPSFGGQKDQVQALKTTAYAFTASWIAGVLVLVPWIGWLLGLAGAVYAIYLLYLGLPHTMRCPEDRRLGYTVVIVLVAIVLSLVLGAVINRVTGVGTGGDATRIEISRGDDSVSLSTDKLEAWSQRMEAAGKRMEQAQQKGDTQAQGEAMGEMMGALLGGGEPVEALAPDAIRKFVPERLGDLPRRSFNVERNTALGIQMTEASARYADEQNSASVDLQITDLGGAQNLAMLAGWAMHESERESDTGYERVRREGNRRIREEWNASSGRGSYTLLLAQRFSVTLESDGVPMDQLKRYAESLPLSDIEALKDAGKKG